MVTRKASVIMIDGIAVNEKNAEDWDAALQSARKAGVPVILLDPVAPPDDDTLFAVTFTLTGKGDGVTALDDAVVTIVDDKPTPHDERHRQPVLTFRYPELFRGSGSPYFRPAGGAVAERLGAAWRFIACRLFRLTTLRRCAPPPARRCGGVGGCGDQPRVTPHPAALDGGRV